MSVVVVVALEMIEVENEEGYAVLLAPLGADDTLNFSVERTSVLEPRERVCRGCIREATVEFVDLDKEHDEDDAGGDERFRLTYVPGLCVSGRGGCVEEPVERRREEGEGDPHLERGRLPQVHSDDRARKRFDTTIAGATMAEKS